jgi:pheromone a factor receptor
MKSMSPLSLRAQLEEAPYQANLTLNLVFRVVLGVLCPLILWVPGKLLWRNGEIAAVLFLSVCALLDWIFAINGLMWRSDDTTTWWDGAGWCDLQMYVVYPVQTLYVCCVFAIMRNLAQQVGLMRVSDLTMTEKRRHNLIQFLILVPTPLIQVILTYFVLDHRYDILTLYGCYNSYDPSLLYLIFFIIPDPLFAVGGAYYAGET